MSTNQSEKIQITITVSQEFHRILKRMAKSFDQTIEKYALALIICGLDCDLETSVSSGTEKKSVAIAVSVPIRFYELLKACADHRDSTPEELTRDALISSVDAELQDNLDAKLGFSRGPGEYDYQSQLRALFQGAPHG